MCTALGEIALKKFRHWFWVASGCAWAVSSVAWAAIGISDAQGLAFGKFVAGSGGTVTVSPAGVRSFSGGVVLVPSGPGAAAQFVVTGDPGLSYSISLPGDGMVSLTSGSNTMAVNDFTSSPTLVGVIGPGGSQTLLVGAKLSVGGNQAHGSYSGTFSVTVNYN